jgi:hypothetical protein
MYLFNSWGQSGFHRAFRADGTITTGNTAQLLLPERKSTSMLLVMNISANPAFLEIGSARATSALTNGTVSSITVTNGGFGFTVPPDIILMGGAQSRVGVTSSLVTAGMPGQDAPGTFSTGRPAVARAVLTGGVVTSIVVTDPGAGYLWPPYVLITNSQNYPFGCASPYFASTFSGIYLAPGGGSYYVNGTACPTDPLAIASATSGGAFTVKWMQ